MRGGIDLSCPVHDSSCPVGHQAVPFAHENEREQAVGEDGIQSTLKCIFNDCYFISRLNNLKISHTIKQLYIHNLMPKHENNTLHKKFYNQYKKGTFAVESAPRMGKFTQFLCKMRS